MSQITKNKTSCMSEEMADFLKNKKNCYAIFQLRDDEAYALELFSSLKELQRMGKKPEFGHYDFICTGGLPDNFTGDKEYAAKLMDMIYATYNVVSPDNSTGRSLSVSDIIALKTQKEISYYFVDSVGFQPLPDFVK